MQSKNDASDIVQLILEYRNKGAFLSYSELEMVQNWIQNASSQQDLILVLSELLPNHYQNSDPTKHPKSLKGIDKKIRAKLKDAAMHR